MKKLLALFLLTPFAFGTEAPLSFKFYEVLVDSNEFMLMKNGDVIESQYFKLTPSENDQLAAVVRCKGAAFARRYKYVDFIIYKSNIGAYKYTQLILTDKKRLKGQVTPLMGFEREDTDGNLYFHNLIDFIGYYGSMNESYLRNYNVVNAFLNQSPKIKINSIFPSVFMKIRPDVMSKTQLAYERKNCEMIDALKVEEDLNTFYKVLEESRRPDVIEEMKKF
ncbi:hypothetical protein N9Q01_00585 [Gammaproteobacteria bacterium]|nr:hypothetical protein [Gammaproteobacteria bacterium]